MTTRVCYIEREDRGAVLRRLRVLGTKTDDVWEAPRTDFSSGQNAACAAAAAWISDRLNGKIGGRVLDRVCLDVDGSVCSWVTANSTDPRLVRALVEQAGGDDSDDAFADAGHSMVGRFPDLPGEVGYQAMGPRREKVGTPVRTPVVAVPDVAARAVIDALDESGVQIGSCITLWQAMMAAWWNRPTSSHDRIVAESSPVLAVVLFLPGDRVVWSWGCSETPIASGAFRTRLGLRTSRPMLTENGEGPVDEANPDSARAVGGRLATEWLAWAAQIGRAPTRVVWIGPLGETVDGGEIGAALRRAAPGASVDVIDEPDPVGLTLRRLAERIDSGEDGKPGPETCLVGLTNRPGRVHRAMYSWLAILFLAASGAMATLAWTFWEKRGESLQRLAEVRANTRALLEVGAPDLVNDQLALRNLRARVEQARSRTLDPGRIPAPKAVLRELETLAFVLGNPDYELQEIDIGALSVSFRVRVDDTLAFEQLQSSLFGIAGSSVAWTPLNPRQTGNRIDVTASGTWLRDDRPGGGDS